MKALFAAVLVWSFVLPVSAEPKKGGGKGGDSAINRSIRVYDAVTYQEVTGAHVVVTSESGFYAEGQTQGRHGKVTFAVPADVNRVLVQVWADGYMAHEAWEDLPDRRTTHIWAYLEPSF